MSVLRTTAINDHLEISRKSPHRVSESGAANYESPIKEIGATGITSINEQVRCTKLLGKVL